MYLCVCVILCVCVCTSSSFGLQYLQFGVDFSEEMGTALGVLKEELYFKLAAGKLHPFPGALELVEVCLCLYLCVLYETLWGFLGRALW